MKLAKVLLRACNFGCYVPAGGFKWGGNYFDHSAPPQSSATLLAKKAEERSWISAARKGLHREGTAEYIVYTWI